MSRDEIARWIQAQDEELLYTPDAPCDPETPERPWRDMCTFDVCRWFGIPAELLGISTEEGEP